MNDIITKHYYLSGTVHGVWCRDFVVREAKAREINGWVRNLSDGRVEVMAQGLTAMIDELEAQLHVGPPLATVENVESEIIADHNEIYFDFKQTKTL